MPIKKIKIFASESLPFVLNGIYKMSPASRSHCLHCYYVEIIEIAKDYIVTNIPGMHSLKITKNENWDYQIPRMKYIGTGHEHAHLLKNQNIKHG